MPLKADTVTKDYVKDAGVFADIFNYYPESVNPKGENVLKIE